MVWCLTGVRAAAGEGVRRDERGGRLGRGIRRHQLDRSHLRGRIAPEVRTKDSQPERDDRALYLRTPQICSATARAIFCPLLLHLQRRFVTLLITRTAILHQQAPPPPPPSSHPHARYGPTQPIALGWHRGVCVSLCACRVAVTRAREIVKTVQAFGERNAPKVIEPPPKVRGFRVRQTWWGDRQTDRHAGRHTRRCG